MVQIGCGCVNLGSASSTASLADQVRLVHAAIDAGITVFDTADAYACGTSERVLGRALVSRRGGVAVSTKAGYVFRRRSALEQRARRLAHRGIAAGRRFGPDDPSTGSRPGGGGDATTYARQDFSVAHLRRSLENSLRRLRTDHVDVFQLHGPPSHDPTLLQDLDDLVRAGTVGRFGVGAETIPSAVDWTPDERIGVVQLPFGVLDPATLETVAPMADHNGVDIWVRGILAGGVLSAVMRDATTAQENPKGEVIAGLLGVADRSGIALDELALRWVVGREEPQVMLLGMSSVAHVQRNIELARRGPLPGDVVDEVDGVIRSTYPQRP